MKKIITLLVAVAVIMSFAAFAEDGGTATLYGMPIDFMGMEFQIGMTRADCEAIVVANGIAEDVTIGSYLGKSEGDFKWATAYSEGLNFTAAIPADVDIKDTTAVPQILNENGRLYEFALSTDVEFTYGTLTQASTPDDVIAFAESNGYEYERNDHSWEEMYDITVTLDAESELIAYFCFTNDSDTMSTFTMSISDKYLAENA